MTQSGHCKTPTSEDFDDGDLIRRPLFGALTGLALDREALCLEGRHGFGLQKELEESARVFRRDEHQSIAEQRVP
jgi:hypothetical protein